MDFIPIAVALGRRSAIDTLTLGKAQQPKTATASVPTEIWRSSSGIADVEDSPEQLCSSDLPGIRTVSKAQRERPKGASLVSDFTERLSREWAIETGIIENLSEIDRGITQALSNSEREVLRLNRKVNSSS